VGRFLIKRNRKRPEHATGKTQRDPNGVRKKKKKVGHTGKESEEPKCKKKVGSIPVCRNLAVDPIKHGQGGNGQKINAR